MKGALGNGWPSGELLNAHQSIYVQDLGVIICEYFLFEKKIATMIPPLPSEHLRLERW